MRTLSRQDLLDLVDGAAVFSAGGGGDPAMGHEIVRRLCSERLVVKFVSSSEVPDDVQVVNFACVGATSSLDYNSNAAAKTLRVLEDFVCHSFYAVLPVELGGFNTLAAVDVAARCGIPVVDADGAGRAVPEVHLKVYTIDKIPLTPMVVSDSYGKNIVIVKETVDLKASERVARILATEWNQCAYTARRILTGTQVKSSPIQSSLSRSMRVGKLLRTSADPLDAVLRSLKGFELFDGIVAHVKRKTKVGFTFINVELRGKGKFSGSLLELKAKNEVLAAYKDGKLAAIAPDIITPVHQKTGKCMPAERIRQNSRLTIVGLPSPLKWRTKEGLELWKDVLQRAGITDQYVRIEKLVMANHD